MQDTIYVLISILLEKNNGFGCFFVAEQLIDGK